MRWLYVVIPIAILLSLVAWRLQLNHVASTTQAQMMKRRGSAPTSVELGTAQYYDLVTSFEATGTVESPQNVNISPRVTGIILTPKANDPKYRTLYEGDFVRAGQIMTLIDPSEYKANVDQAKAALAQAKFHLTQAQLTQNPTDVQVSTQIRQMQAGVNSAHANYNQAVRNFSAQKAAAQAAVNDATSKVASAEVAVDNAKQGITSALANQDSAQTAVENAQTGIASAEANRDSAQTAIENAQASINSAQANLVDAKAKYERTEKLYEQKYETKQDVDDAKAALDVQQAAKEVAEGQFRMASSSLKVQQAAVETAKGQLKMAQSALNVQRGRRGISPGASNAPRKPPLSPRRKKKTSAERTIQYRRHQRRRIYQGYRGFIESSERVAYLC